jgi:hypothetical protein
MEGYIGVLGACILHVCAWCRSTSMRCSGEGERLARANGYLCGMTVLIYL